jgi:antitoxin ParD1/3/4
MTTKNRQRLWIITKIWQLYFKRINNGRNAFVSLGDHFETFVDERIAAGRFKNASEVIRAGLRLLEEEDGKILALRKAIKDGTDSGIAKDFNPKKQLANLKNRKKQHGYIPTNE